MTTSSQHEVSMRMEHQVQAVSMGMEHEVQVVSMEMKHKVQVVSMGDVRIFCMKIEHKCK